MSGIGSPVSLCPFGARGFKSHSRRHSDFHTESVKEFFYFQIPPGGREIVSRKKKDKKKCSLETLGYRYKSGILISVAAFSQATSWRKNSCPGIRLTITQVAGVLLFQRSSHRLLYPTPCQGNRNRWSARTVTRLSRWALDTVPNVETRSLLLPGRQCPLYLQPPSGTLL